MNQMLDALQAAGLVRDHNTPSARPTSGQTARQFTLAKGRPVRVDDLGQAGSINEFKRLAERLLMQDRKLAEVVVRSAHRFEHEAGGKKLAWICYQVRDMIASVPTDCVSAFLSRAFRANNPTLERFW